MNIRPCGAVSKMRSNKEPLRRSAALVFPLTLFATPVFAQTGVKEDSVVLQPDKVTDDAPVVETVTEANLPSWSEANATELLSFIEKVGSELRAMMPWIAKNKLVDKAKN